MSSASTCGFCEEREPTLSCQQCEAVFCEKCGANLHEKGIFRSHTLVAIENAVREKSRFCKEHEGEKLTLYCVEDRCFVCSHCVIVGDHRGHDCKSLKVAFSEGKESLQQQLVALEVKRSDLTTMMEGLDGIKNQVENAAGEMQKDIDSQIKAINEVLQRREAELILQVQRLEQTKLAQLAEQSEDLENIHKNLSQCLSLVDDVLTKKDPYEFLAAAAAVEEKAESNISSSLEAQGRAGVSFHLELNISNPLTAIHALNMHFTDPSLGGERSVAPSPSRGNMGTNSTALETVASRSADGKFLSNSTPDRRSSGHATETKLPNHTAISAQPQSAGPPTPSPLKSISAGASSVSSVSSFLSGPSTPAAPAKNLADYVQMGENGNFLKLSNLTLTETDLRGLATLLQANRSLTTVDLTDSRIRDTGATVVAQALCNNSTVSAIGLSGNRITDTGGRALAAMLQTNRCLLSLYLRNNEIGPDGAKFLSDALVINKTLLKLNLKNNKLGPAGARHIADMLAANKMLQEVNLYNNNIGAEGGEAIGAVLADCSLTELELGSNSIGDNGVKAIAVGVERNVHLVRLQLRWNSIGDDGALALSESLRHNHTLQEIQLGGNQIQRDGESAIAAVCLSNHRLKVVQ